MIGESEQERGRVAVTTVSRMIQNLAAAPEDPKLRSIRVSNKAFQSKVAVVPGGAELLVAAGYAYRTCSTGTSGGAATDQVRGEGEGEGEGELFLVHDMDKGGRGKLHYTLSRYNTNQQFLYNHNYRKNYYANFMLLEFRSFWRT